MTMQGALGLHTLHEEDNGLDSLSYLLALISAS
jgi:hypothetical protein